MNETGISHMLNTHSSFYEPPLLPMGSKAKGKLVASYLGQQALSWQARKKSQS
jgi:hypothetical protein